MTDGKNQNAAIALEPGQAALVPGIEGDEMTRRLFAGPETDAMLDDDQAGIPFNDFLASVFLVRLDHDEAFGAELAGRYDETLR